MPKLARADGWRKVDDRPTMRFERFRGGRVLEHDRHEEVDEPEVPTVRVPERGARVTLRSPTATKKQPPPVPRMRALAAPRPAPSPPRADVPPDERESGIRTRPPVRELATIEAIGMPRRRLAPTQAPPQPLRRTLRSSFAEPPVSETLLSTTPMAGVPSLVLKGPARSVVFEATPVATPATPATPAIATVVIAPPPPPTARRRPTMLVTRPTPTRLPFLLLLVAIAFVAIAFVAIAFVQFVPAIRRASAAIALR